LLNIEEEIGNWYCYPKKSTLFDTKIYVFIESKDNFLVSFNVSPESLTWDSYCISIKLIELQSFIKALNTVNKGYTIKKSGIGSRRITVDSTYKYTMYEKVSIWEIPISIKTITVGVESLSELIQDFLSKEKYG
jgi:hypothetical protein